MKIVDIKRCHNPDPGNHPDIYWGDAIVCGAKYRCVWVADGAAFLVMDKATPALKAAFRETFRRAVQS